MNFQKKLGQARRFLLGGDFAAALPRYEELTRLGGGDAVVWFEYGNAAAAGQKRDLAERAWRKAAELAPRQAGMLLQIGHQYQALRRPREACAYFSQAAAADPRAIDPRISLALLAEQNHSLAEARAAVEECLAIDPRDEQARYLAAVLDRREHHLERAESGLRDLIAATIRHPYVRYACRYELARICDETGRCEEAMRLLAHAKQMVGSLADIGKLLRVYDAEADNNRGWARALPRTILRTWAEAYRAEEREPIPRLAFLGGHPRSGTTLLEQVLAAHPAVAALDEPTAFPNVPLRDLPDLNQLPPAILNGLRRIYREALLREAGNEAQNKLLLDKNPSPTARLPVRLRVLPESRVLIALRDPRDVALSCYFQNILLNPTNANFLSIERIAKHYGDLMDVWLAVREWEGFAWRETRYEDLVAELEQEGRRVLEFLGLSWHEGQARFYEKNPQKQLHSPTYRDVTRPVYRSSVGRWQAYEKYLAPILPILEPYCRKLGYV